MFSGISSVTMTSTPPKGPAGAVVHPLGCTWLTRTVQLETQAPLSVEPASTLLQSKFASQYMLPFLATSGVLSALMVKLASADWVTVGVLRVDLFV